MLPATRGHIEYPTEAECDAVQIGDDLYVWGSGSSTYLKRDDGHNTPHTVALSSAELQAFLDWVRQHPSVQG